MDLIAFRLKNVPVEGDSRPDGKPWLRIGRGVPGVPGRAPALERSRDEWRAEQWSRARGVGVGVGLARRAGACGGDVPPRSGRDGELRSSARSI
ncbi:MAG: hypothetical protein U0232_18580 [Thermomicrobiales bacterium]